MGSGGSAGGRRVGLGLVGMFEDVANEFGGGCEFGGRLEVGGAEALGEVAEHGGAEPFVDADAEGREE